MSTRAFAGIVAAEPSEDLRRVRRGLARYGEAMRSTIFSAAGGQLTSAWQEELFSAASAGFSDTQRIIVANNPQALPHVLGLAVATGGSGRLGFLTKAYEFGTLNRDEYTEVHFRGRPRKVGGRVVARSSYLRRTKRQLPPRSQTGWIAYPAAKRLGARVFAMYLQIVVKLGHDATEGNL